MDADGGMVAVVRGMRDAGLAVTLLENGNQYVLSPNTHTAPVASSPTSIPVHMQNSRNSYVQNLHNMQLHNMHHGVNVPHIHQPQMQPQIPQKRSVAVEAETPKSGSSSFGTQAVDGRYATVYQTTVGKREPTSPIVTVTEFPPQRPGPSLCRGHDNFVVGGTGSGDTTYNAVKVQNSFRGAGLVWPDRGSVCAARPSRQPDAFENSLRKYPRVSPDHSTEIIERFITYSQAKNFNKSPSVNSNSQTRHCELAEPRSVPKPAVWRSENVYQSPTRATDAKYLRDMSRMVREHTKNLTNSNPYVPVRHRSPQRSEELRGRGQEQNSPNMVNSEIQAAATMVCKKVATSSPPPVSRRNVAVSSVSDMEQLPEGGVLSFFQNSDQSLDTVRMSVETPQNTIDVSSSSFVPNFRRTRSEEYFSSDSQTIEFLISETVGSVYNQESQFMLYTDDSIDNSSESYAFYSESNDRYKTQEKPFRNTKRNLTVLSYPCFDLQYDFLRSQVSSYYTCNEVDRKVISSWVNELPLKKQDFLGRSIKKDQISNFIICRLNMIPIEVSFDKRMFREEIIDIVDDVPFDIVIHNKDILLHKLAEDLICRLENARLQGLYGDKFSRRNHNRNEVNMTNTNKDNEKDTKLTNDELNLNDQIMPQTQCSVVNLDVKKSAKIDTNIVHYLTNPFLDINKSENRVTKDVENKALTCSDTEKVPKVESIISSYTNLLMKKLSQISMKLEQTDIRITPEFNPNLQTDNEEMCAKATNQQTCDKYMQQENNSIQYSGRSFDADLKSNAESYRKIIAIIIEDWLNGIDKDVPYALNHILRNAAINDLAKDIVERRKYLQLDPLRSIIEMEELELLKYQIFKWVNKFVGDYRIVTLERAPELMQKIKTVSVPVLTKFMTSHAVLNSHSGSYSANLQMNALKSTSQVIKKSSAVSMVVSIGTHTSDISTDLTSKNTEGHQTPIWTRNKSISVMAAFKRDKDKSSGMSSSKLTDKAIKTTKKYKKDNTEDHTSKSGEKFNKDNKEKPPSESAQIINDEFIAYVDEWVQLIPLPEDSEDKRELNEKLRLGLTHGVWKAITKAKSTPGVLGNQFYYEDVLDDEIEHLFSLLPETDELNSKKAKLKADLINNVTVFTEKIKRCYYPQTYVQQVAKGLTVYIPRKTTNTEGEDPVRLNEELKIIYIVDEYILFMADALDNPAVESAHRSKLLKLVEEFVKELKNNHEKEFAHIDTSIYKNDIFAAMQAVPIPTEETLRREADIIMLEMEIDKWFKDLPLNPNDESTEYLKRIRLRDKLAKKIYDIEKSAADFKDDSADVDIQHEASQVLEKLPLSKDQSAKITALSVDLVDRIKNRPRERPSKRIPTCNNTTGQLRPPHPAMPGVSHYPFGQPPPTSHQSGTHTQFVPTTMRGVAWQLPSPPTPQPRPEPLPPPKRYEGPQEQNADGSMWLSGYLQNYEAAHPPVSTPPLAMNSNMIHTASQFEEFEKQNPAASSFHEVHQRPCGLLQQNVLSNSVLTSTSPKQTTASPQHINVTVNSGSAADANGFMSIAQESYRAPAQQPQRQFPGMAETILQPVVNDQVLEAANQTGPLWLSKYLKEYEAEHPPSKYDSSLPYNPNISIPQKPQNTTIENPDAFGDLGSESLLSSSKRPLNAQSAVPSQKTSFNGPSACSEHKSNQLCHCKKVCKCKKAIKDQNVEQKNVSKSQQTMGLHSTSVPQQTVKPQYVSVPQSTSIGPPYVTKPQQQALASQNVTAPQPATVGVQHENISQQISMGSQNVCGPQQSSIGRQNDSTPQQTLLESQYVSIPLASPIRPQNVSVPQGSPMGPQNASTSQRSPMEPQNVSVPRGNLMGAQNVSVPQEKLIGPQNFTVPQGRPMGPQNVSVPRGNPMGAQNVSVPRGNPMEAQNVSVPRGNPMEAQNVSVPQGSTMGPQYTSACQNTQSLVGLASQSRDTQVTPTPHKDQWVQMDPNKICEDISIKEVWVNESGSRAGGSRPRPRSRKRGPGSNKGDDDDDTDDDDAICRCRFKKLRRHSKCHSYSVIDFGCPFFGRIIAPPVFY